MKTLLSDAPPAILELENSGSIESTMRINAGPIETSLTVGFGFAA